MENGGPVEKCWTDFASMEEQLKDMEKG